MTTAETAWHELCAWTLTRGDATFVHQHVVDAWTAQRADPTTKPIALFFALMGLYLHVEHGWDGRAVQRGHMRLAQRPEAWPIFTLPAARGDLTVHDVLACTVESERAEAISHWAASVWSAYVAHREVIDAVLVRRGLR